MLKNKYFQRFVRILALSLVVVLVVAAGLTLFVFRPIYPDPIPPVEQLSYEQSLQRINEKIFTRDDASVNPVCQSRLLSHGQKTAKIMVFFHGFTNCPAQFEQLGQKFYEKGYNVYIPRLPYHGLQDRLTTAPSRLTPQDLIDFTMESIKLSTGLGDEISLFGLSGGGIMAAFGGYHSNKVKNIFIAAPLFAPGSFTEWQVPLIANFLVLQPDTFTWWDENQKEKIAGPSYAYPRFSNRALASFISLSHQAQQSLESGLVSQSGKSIVLLTTEGDQAINNNVALDIAKNWGNYAGVKLTMYRFEKSKVKLHDFIDPNQRNNSIDLVYQTVLDLADKV